MLFPSEPSMFTLAFTIYPLDAPFLIIDIVLVSSKLIRHSPSTSLILPSSSASLSSSLSISDSTLLDKALKSFVITSLAARSSVSAFVALETSFEIAVCNAVSALVALTTSLLIAASSSLSLLVERVTSLLILVSSSASFAVALVISSERSSSSSRSAPMALVISLLSVRIVDSISSSAESILSSSASIAAALSVMPFPGT